MVEDLVLARDGHEGDPERVSDMSGGSPRLGGPLEGEDASPENLPGLVCVENGLKGVQAPRLCAFIRNGPELP